MKATYKRALVIFSTTALAVFTVLFGSDALATVYTIDGRDCVRTNVGQECPIRGGGEVSTGISIVYFDFNSAGSGKVYTSVVWRSTYNGTVTHANSADVLNAGFHETSVRTSDLIVNRSAWDYYSAGVSTGGDPGAYVTLVGIAYQTF